MDYLPQYLGVLVLAAAAGRGLYSATVWIATGRRPALIERAAERLHRTPPPSEPVPGVLLELELARLAGELSRATQEPQGRAVRIRACTIAYDDALVACCRSYGFEAPSSPRPLTADQRLEAESVLLTHGVDW